MIKLSLTITILLAAQGCGDAAQSVLDNLSGGRSSGAKAQLNAGVELEPTAEETAQVEEIAAPQTKVEVAPKAAVQIESEPVSEAKAVFNAAGIQSYLIEGETRSAAYVRAMDQAAAELAIEEIKILQGNLVTWDLLLRPNDEILTSKGFVSPPPSIQDILNARDIYVYELQDGVIKVFERQLASARGALDVLMVFYPDTNWSIETMPEPTPEEPETEPETP